MATRLFPGKTFACTQSDSAVVASSLYLYDWIPVWSWYQGSMLLLLGLMRLLLYELDAELLIECQGGHLFY